MKKLVFGLCILLAFSAISVSLAFSKQNQPLVDESSATVQPLLTHLTEEIELENLPIISWQESTYDFGKIEQNKPVTHTFEFMNQGKSPLIIENVKASCGCTVPSWTKEPIDSGKSGTIKAEYNAKKAGKFSKTLTVMSNAGEVERLTIKGEVLANEK